MSTARLVDELEQALGEVPMLDVHTHVVIATSPNHVY